MIRRAPFCRHSAFAVKLLNLIKPCRSYYSMTLYHMGGCGLSLSLVSSRGSTQVHAVHMPSQCTCSA